MSEPVFNFLEEGTLLSLLDEDNRECKFEAIATLDLDDERYIGLTPYSDNPSMDDGSLVVLKSSIDENGEEIYLTIDSEEEYDRIGNLFINAFEEQAESWYDDEN